jgi:excisionase family DNA binding protein
METPETKSAPARPRWYSIKEAAEYLDVGEPTLYRWMREQKITYRKIGDSTRFTQEDLDGMVQVFRSTREIARVEEVCPACNQGELIEGQLQSTGLCYFRPQKTKFWTLKDANIGTRARMCARCGCIVLFGDTQKLAALREENANQAGAGAGVIANEA